MSCTPALLTHRVAMAIGVALYCLLYIIFSKQCLGLSFSSVVAFLYPDVILLSILLKLLPYIIHLLFLLLRILQLK